MLYLSHYFMLIIHQYLTVTIVDVTFYETEAITNGYLRVPKEAGYLIGTFCHY